MVRCFVSLDNVSDSAPVSSNDVNPRASLLVGHACVLVVFERISNIALNLVVAGSAVEVVQPAGIMCRSNWTEEVCDGLRQTTGICLVERLKCGLHGRAWAYECRNQTSIVALVRRVSRLQLVYLTLGHVADYVCSKPAGVCLMMLLVLACRCLGCLFADDPRACRQVVVGPCSASAHKLVSNSLVCPR